MTDATVVRWVSFYEIYATPDGSRARLGTGTYDAVFSREVSTPHIACFFSHVTDAYLHSFARFGLAHFDKSAQKMVCDYDSSFEKTGGPLWLARMADNLITAGLACIPSELVAPQEGYWVAMIHGQQPRLIASSQALAELAGKESQGGEFVIHVLFQGSLTAITALSWGA